jgi:tripartite-type tricarboxylate transporter receptor subunit TctC
VTAETEKGNRMNYAIQKNSRRSLLIAAALMCSVLPLSVGAQNWPDKPIKIVVPAPGGSAVEVMARLLSDKLQARTGQPVVVDTRPGADGGIAAVAVKTATDGHTFLLGNAGIMTINPHFNARLPYDPVKDFMPVSMLVNNVVVMTVSPALSVNNVKELIALSKQQSGRINYASVGGRGGVPFLSGQLLRQRAGADLTWIGYASEAQARTDLMGVQIQVMFDVLASTLPLVQAGKLKIIAVTGTQRAPQLPDVPTLIEATGAGVEGVGWLALYAPAGTPETAVNAMNQHLRAILAMPDIRERLNVLGMEPVPGSPQALARTQRDDFVKWERLIQDQKILPQ